MRILIPQLAPASEDRVSGAQVVDGSLKFDNNKSQYLTRTPSSAGNRSAYTGSVWVKRTKFAPSNNSNSNDFNYMIFSAGTSSANNIDEIKFYKNAGDDHNAIAYMAYPGSTQYLVVTNAKFRDPNGWYNVVWNYDGTTARLYVNGEEATSLETNTQNGGSSGHFNNTVEHVIGHTCDQANSSKFDGYMSQFNWIDGLTLGPGYFGYTDPLTNTWRPKKFRAQGTTVNDGTQWSSGGGSGLYSDGSGSSTWGSLFDGTPATDGSDITTSPYVTNDGTSTVTFPKPISGILRFRACQGSNSTSSGDGRPYVTLSDGQEIRVDGANNSPSSHSFGYVSGITSVTINGTSAQGMNLLFLQVDGVLMIDSTTTNLDFGTNGFYLPMDGNSPIGQDESGKGNDFTPVNIDGSNSLDKSTGALPILNTVSGGNYATVGERTDSLSSNLKLAVDHDGSAIDRTNAINGNTNLMTSFTATNTTYAYPTDASGAPYNSALYFNGTSDRTDLNFTAGDFNFMHNQDDSGTVEFWFYNGAFSTEAVLFANTAGSPDIGFGINASGSTGVLAFLARGVSGSTKNTSVASLPQNKWTHIALTKQKVGSNVELKLYVNGILGGENTSITATDLSNSNSTYNYFRTGCPIGHEGSRGWTNAYMSDLRIYNTVKYTSDFVVASTSPDILPDTPSGVSLSSGITKITDGSVSFDGSGDYLTAGQSEDYNFGTGSFTIECFAYFNNVTSNQDITDFTNNASATGSPGGQFYFSSSGGGTLMWYESSTQYAAAAGKITPKRWHHLAVVKNSSGDTIKIYINGKEEGSSSHTETSGTNAGSLRIGLQGSTYFNGFLSNLRVIKGTALYTSNFTPPARTLTNVTNTKLLCCQSNTLAGAADVSPSISGINDGTVWSEEATIAPPSSGFNPGGGIIQAFDGSTTTLTSGAGGRDEFFVIDFSRDITVSTSLEVWMNSGASQFKVNDGSFSSSLNNGAWRSLSFTGTLSKLTVKGDSPQTFGNFAPRLSAIRIDGSVILTDPVTRNGDVSATTFNSFTTDIDTVRGQETGYNTLNPLAKASITLSNGNLDLAHSGSTGYWQLVLSTIGMSSGKFYCEFLCKDSDSVIGIAKGDHVIANDKYVGQDPGGYSYNGQNGQKINNSSGSSYGSSYGAEDLIGIAFDADNGTLRFYKNNVDQGQAFTGLTDEYFFAFSIRDTGYTHSVNFGQKPFKFPPPAGFQPLNAANVRPETVIPRPNQYMNTVTYTGTGSDLTLDVGFKPDLSYFSVQSATGYIKYIFDSVRGATKYLATSGSQGDDAEGTSSSTLKSFNTNGVTIGNNAQMNENSNNTWVSWHWKAGGNKNTFNVDDVGYASASDVGMNVGASNSSAYNKTQRWRDASSGSLYSGQSFATLFNNSIQGIHSSANNTLTLTLPTALSGNLKIWLARGTGASSPGANYDIRVNGISVFNNSILPYNTNSVVDFGHFDTINSISWGSGSIGNDWIQFNKIFIDGAELVDDDVSTSNVPSIAPTGASVGTKQGFSIVTFNSGSDGSIGHGLNKKPGLILMKNRDQSSIDWRVWHQSFSNPQRDELYLNTDGPVATSGVDVWGTPGGYPNNSTLWFRYASTAGGGARNIVCYCWHDIPGLQKFGQYTGNNDSDADDGPFVELGFRPALVVIKRSNGTGNWIVYDNKRDTFNPTNKRLYWNTNVAEATNSGYDIDFLSNGFKITGGNNDNYNAASTYVYAAWAEEPAFNLYGGQSNAR